MIDVRDFAFLCSTLLVEAELKVFPEVPFLISFFFVLACCFCSRKTMKRKREDTDSIPFSL